MNYKGKIPTVFYINWWRINTFKPINVKEATNFYNVLSKDLYRNKNKIIGVSYERIYTNILILKLRTIFKRKFL